VLPSILPDDTSADPRAYVRIADTVRQWLDEGILKPGDKVRISDLAQNYCVARQTVAKGLHLLAGEGRLKRFPGFGYAVQHASAEQPGLAAAGHPCSGGPAVITVDGTRAEPGRARPGSTAGTSETRRPCPAG